MSLMAIAEKELQLGTNPANELSTKESRRDGSHSIYITRVII